MERNFSCPLTDEACENPNCKVGLCADEHDRDAKRETGEAQRISVAFESNDIPRAMDLLMRDETDEDFERSLAEVSRQAQREASFKASRRKVRRAKRTR